MIRIYCTYIFYGIAFCSECTILMVFIWCCLLCNHEIIFRPNEWPPAAFQQNTHLNEIEDNSQFRNIYVCMCHRDCSPLFCSCTFLKKTNFISILWKKDSQRTNILSASISPGFRFINHTTNQSFWCLNVSNFIQKHTTACIFRSLYVSALGEFGFSPNPENFKFRMDLLLIWKPNLLFNRF